MTGIVLDCASVADAGLDELYVAGRLGGEDRESFEQHYFGCRACFERVALLCATRARLDPPAAARTHRLGRGLVTPMAAAGVAACVVASVWLLPRPVPQAAQDTAVTAPPFTAPAAARALPLFEPPAFQPQTLRGLGDEAAVQFRSAMAHYTARRFADAIPGLSHAAPRRVDAAFFLAACQLLTGDATRAAAAARQAIAFGDTPYLEDARLLLARALRQLGDTGAARAELERVAAMDGERRAEAERLLGDLSAGR